MANSIPQIKVTVNSETTTITNNADEKFSRYLLLQSSKSDERITDKNPYIIEKALNGIIGMDHNCEIKPLRSGHYLIVADQKSKADQLIKVTKLHTFDVKIEPHKALNTSKGVVHCPAIDSMSIDEILAELQESGQKVKEVYRINKRGRNGPEKTHTYIFTFDRPNIPKTVKIGVLREKVRLYIPKPRRCFKCQQYGHGQNNCSHETVCCKCGEVDDHDYDRCDHNVCCYHCGDSHEASSMECPKWKLEEAIIRLKFTENIKQGQAKTRVYDKFPDLVQKLKHETYKKKQTWSEVAASPTPPTTTTPTTTATTSTSQTQQYQKELEEIKENQKMMQLTINRLLDLLANFIPRSSFQSGLVPYYLKGHHLSNSQETNNTNNSSEQSQNNEESDMESQDLPDIQTVNRSRKRVFSEEEKHSSSASPLLKQRPSSGGQEGKNSPASPTPSDPKGKGDRRNPSTPSNKVGEGAKGGPSASTKEARGAVSTNKNSKPAFNRISAPSKKTTR